MIPYVFACTTTVSVCAALVITHPVQGLDGFGQSANGGVTCGEIGKTL